MSNTQLLKVSPLRKETVEERDERVSKFREVVEKSGGLSMLARYSSLTLGVFQGWLGARKLKPSLEQAIIVEKATNHLCTARDLRPEVFELLDDIGAKIVFKDEEEEQK